MKKKSKSKLNERQLTVIGYKILLTHKVLIVNDEAGTLVKRKKIIILKLLI